MHTEYVAKVFGTKAATKKIVEGFKGTFYHTFNKTQFTQENLPLFLIGT